MNSNENERVVTLNELSRRLHVPAGWLRQEAQEGRLPHLRAASGLLFNLAAVERVLAERAAANERQLPDAR